MTADANTAVEIEISALSNASCRRIYRIRETIEMNPVYQRQGNIWSKDNKQLFIDSVLNGFDIPKLYLHDGTPVAAGHKYAVIDGKQRLQAIFEFYENEFPLADSFDLFNTGEREAMGVSEDQRSAMAGMYYRDLDETFPEVARTLDSRTLPIMVVATDDIEAIEEMFSRLNDAVPLNAAEKRQAIGDPMRAFVRDLSGEGFFESRLPFENKRYRHYDLAAKFLKWAEGAQESNAGLPISPQKLDVKRAQLDRLFKVAKSSPADERWTEAFEQAQKTCTALEAAFQHKDALLSSVGTVSVVYLDALEFLRDVRPSLLTRSMLLEFESFRRERSNLETEDSQLIVGALTIAEYNRLTQSPNDGAALAKRLEILWAFADAVENGQEPLKALSVADLVD